MKVSEITEQVGDMANEPIQPGDPIALGFRWGDTEDYVERLLDTLPDRGFLRPIYHDGNIVGISARPPRDVEALQQFLNSRGADLAVDGAYGPQTQRALEQYFTRMRSQTLPMSDLLRGVQ